MTACFIGRCAYPIERDSESAAKFLYRNGPPISFGSCRLCPSAKIAKNWPPVGSRWSARPVPPSVSVTG